MFKLIKVKFEYKNNKIIGFKVSGHANYDDYGKDIVCASVSSIVITSINLMISIDSNSISYVDADGLINCKVLKENEIINKVILNMKDMLEQLEKEYKKNVKIL